MDLFYLTVAAGAVTISGYLFLLFLKSRRGVCTSNADLSGKTVIITGATSGIFFVHNQGIEFCVEVFVSSQNYSTNLLKDIACPSMYWKIYTTRVEYFKNIQFKSYVFMTGFHSMLLPNSILFYSTDWYLVTHEPINYFTIMYPWLNIPVFT